MKFGYNWPIGSSGDALNLQNMRDVGSIFKTNFDLLYHNSSCTHLGNCIPIF